MGKASLFFFFAICFIHSSFSQDRNFTRYDSLRGSLNKYRSSYDVRYYNLSLLLNPAQKSISGKNQILFFSLQNIDTLQLDLFSNLSIDSVIYLGQTLNYRRDSNHVFIGLQKKIPKNALHQLDIFYHGVPQPALNPPWNGGFVWEKDSLDRDWIGVACEGMGASSWWPCKDHLSDEPDSVKLEFEIPSDLVCIANGSLKKVEKIKSGNVKYTWEVHYPINSYNVTFYAGHYSHLKDSMSLGNNSKLYLDYYVLDYHSAIAERHFKQVQKILQCFNKRFGPYPFSKDGYALVETSYWGMEHQGAIAYGNHFKNDMYGYDFIIVHETAHEWWGNSISVRDHADMWIHESFATYSESILLEDTYGAATAIEYLLKQRGKIMNKEAMQGPLNVNYNGWKDTDIYYKGAWMLHTLRNTVNNDTLWFSMLRHLAETFRLRSVNTAEVINEINTFLKKDFSAFFQTYLNCAPIPVFENYYDNDKKLFYFKWQTCTGSFNLSLPVLLGKKELWLNPTENWKSIKMKKDEFSTVEFPTHLFYFQPKSVPH